MKWIKYIFSSSGQMLEKAMEYNAYNLEIAKKEAVHGEYTIEEEKEEFKR